MHESLRVLLVNASFHLKQGGPASSVAQLGSSLVARGLTVGLWAPDESAPQSSVASPEVLRFTGSLERALSDFGRVDCIHDNGIWLPHNHRVARLSIDFGIPRVVSLRGMLQPAALSYRRWKKALAWRLYQRRDLELATFLHVTSSAEAEQVRSLGLPGRVAEIANGTVVSELSPAQPRTSTAKTALYLGRLHPIKGLPTLLRAWADVRPHGWRLVIAGPAESGHDKHIDALIRRLDISDTVARRGAVYGSAKEALFAAADLLVLPSISENFGMVVVESLMRGVPVLTTRGTPWGLLPTHRCGWWVPPDVDGLRQGLVSATQTPVKELEQMGKRGSYLAREMFCWNVIGAEFEELYRRAIREL